MRIPTKRTLVPALSSGQAGGLIDRMSRTTAVTVCGALALLLGAGTALGATIVGTPRGDVLRGTAKADVLYGKAGNDRLFGLSGNDVLVGGPGNDVLTGGPGADVLRCGTGTDVAVAGVGDRIGVDCESVRGLPSLSIVDAAIVEGDSGTTMFAMSVTLSTPVSHVVSVRFATADGTATSPGDYRAAAGTLSFSPGETAKTIDVAVTGDIDVEADETFTVTLSSPVNATIASGRATGTIRNEDVPRPRAGRYGGTTAQGRSISFEVSSDATQLSSLTIRLDMSCPSVGVTLWTDEELAFGSASMPITPRTWAFGVNVPFSDPEVTGNFSFTGSLVAPGSASGTFRFDLIINTPYGAVACSSGTVGWNAS